MESAAEKNAAVHYARGFFVAALAYFVIFSASAVPIPLYSEYKLTIGLTDADISVAMATYLLGVLGILFFAGRISMRWDAAPPRRLPACFPQAAASCSSW